MLSLVTTHTLWNRQQGPIYFHVSASSSEDTSQASFHLKAPMLSLVVEGQAVVVLESMKTEPVLRTDVASIEGCRFPEKR